MNIPRTLLITIFVLVAMSSTCALASAPKPETPDSSGLQPVEDRLVVFEGFLRSG